MTSMQILLGTLPLIVAILGAAIHLGMKIGRFEELIHAVSRAQLTFATDLTQHILHDEKLFSDLNTALRGYADSLNRLVGAVTGKAS